MSCLTIARGLQADIFADSSTNCGVRGDDTQSVLLHSTPTVSQTMTATSPMGGRNADESMRVAERKGCLIQH